MTAPQGTTDQGASLRGRPFYSLLLALSVFLAGCGASLSLPLPDFFRSTAQQAEIMPGQPLTLDGLDSGTGILVLRIPLRKEPAGPSTTIIATRNHGEQVKFVQRDAESVLVETKDGRRGWVSTWFIKELK